MAPEPRPASAAARIIRPFRASDTDSILGILRQAAEAAQWPLESYAKLADSPGGLLLVCELPPNHQLVGLIAARQVTDEGEILNIAVHPDFRRLGVASALLRAALTQFQHSAIARVFLELRESNLPARSLYEQHGFVLSGRRKAYYRQPIEDALCMHKKLTTPQA
jgi:[ribosomal protein S18]-alanine N-acetyltransferase